MRKVLLLHPPYYEFGDYGYHDMPPMGLLKIARYLKNKNVDFEYYDFSHPMRIAHNNVNLKDSHREAPFVRYIKCGNFENEGIVKPQKYYGAPHSIIRQKIRDANPTEIWISTNLTYYWEGARDVAIICKDEHPDVPVLIGGIYASLMPDHCSKNIPNDYVHIGPFEDIDDLMPDYSVDNLRKDSSIRTIQLGKGCNVNPPCSFCAVVSMDPKFKSLKPDPLMSYILQEHGNGVNFFKFWSSQLLVPQSRIIELMKKIINSGIKIQMVASEGVQPSLFTQEISDLMYKAGFASVSIPMESINEDQVKDFRKPSDFNDYEKAVEIAQKSGFDFIKSFVMAGIPGQTYDEIIHAIVDCWARGVHSAIHQYTPIPGSYDWTRFTQFHNKSPEELHPSLWPGASEDLTVESLEEIKRISSIGPYYFKSFYIKEDKKNPLLWEIFRKYCEEYGIFNKDLKYNFKTPLSIKEYVPRWLHLLRKTLRTENLSTPSLMK
jgi:radical SAM superfamily enzyme YgiQ (UPF0313 family)